jgi:hypothetical protein
MSKLLNIFLVFLILFILSCNKTKPTITIEKEVLIPILADMHIAQEMILKFRVVERDSVRRLYYHEISQIHNVDTASITNELKILQANPDLAFEIYEKVYKHIDGMSENNKSN